MKIGHNTELEEYRKMKEEMIENRITACETRMTALDNENKNTYALLQEIKAYMLKQEKNTPRWLIFILYAIYSLACSIITFIVLYFTLKPKV